MRKEIAMATYYIGADVHVNNTELAVEHRGKIVARYSVPTTIWAIDKHMARQGGPWAVFSSCIIMTFNAITTSVC
jgi:hypothetical protein